jgi:hypothetical protein
VNLCYEGAFEGRRWPILVDVSRMLQEKHVD